LRGAQFFRQSGHLRLRVSCGSGRIDCVSSVFEFFIAGHLKRDAAARFGFSEAARDETLELLFASAPNDDEAIQAFVHACLDKERCFDENGIARVFLFPLCELRTHGFFDAGMKNGIQLYEFLWVGEDDCAEFFAVDGFVRPQNFVAEFFYDWFVGRLIVLEEFVAELIGVENAKVHFTQAGRDKTLAAGDSSG